MKDGSPWTARLNASESSALAGLRLYAGLEVAEVGEVIWLRGADWSEALRLALRKVPGLDRFELSAGGRLLADGARVPQGRLPELPWQPMARWASVSLRAAPGLVAPPARAALRLVRSSVERAAGGVLAGLPAWHDFAIGAAEIRLRPLRFAAARDGRAWIEGIPLPALPGRRFSIEGGIAIPCGFKCSPALSAAPLRRWLGLADGDVALVGEDGLWEIIKTEQFVPATRSAVRTTAEALAHG
jgi:MoxR-vWA-beta-propeller ternary system domain bpX2